MWTSASEMRHKHSLFSLATQKAFKLNFLLSPFFAFIPLQSKPLPFSCSATICSTKKSSSLSRLDLGFGRCWSRRFYLDLWAWDFRSHKCRSEVRTQFEAIHANWNIQIWIEDFKWQHRNIQAQNESSSVNNWNVVSEKNFVIIRHCEVVNM